MLPDHTHASSVHDQHYLNILPHLLELTSYETGFRAEVVFECLALIILTHYVEKSSSISVQPHN